MANNKATEEMAKVSPSQKPFCRKNYYAMLGCLLMIIIGFLLMSGSGSSAETFNPEIFSTRRIIVGPTIAFLGFLLMSFAILWKPAEADAEDVKQNN